jgi:hypothetical protein
MNFKKITGMMIVLCLAQAFMLSCDNEETDKTTGVTPAEFKTHIVSKGFLDDDRYRIVCKGNIPKDLSGPAAFESGKRAALLAAYVTAKSHFGDNFPADKLGTIEKVEQEGDHVVVQYLVKKHGLKKIFRE